MLRQPETWRKVLGTLLLIMLLATAVRPLSSPNIIAVDLGWSTPQYISYNQGNSEAPRIAVDSEGNLYVVWKDYTTGNSGILADTRPSNGNWSALEPIPDTSAGSGNPSLAIDYEGSLHVVWTDNITGESGIFYANRPSGGNWSAPQKITGSSDNSTAPDIAADGQGNLHVVWQEGLEEAPDILYTTKPSDGSWAEQPINISNTIWWSMSPSIAVDGEGNVHVVWRDNDDTIDITGGYSDIFYATKPSDSGWSVPQNISHSERNSSRPRIAVDSENNPHVVWEETYDQYATDIRPRYNTRSGDSWLAEPETISPTSQTSNRTLQFRYPSIAVDHLGEPCVVWQDNVLVGTDNRTFWSIAYAIRQSNGGWLGWSNIISQMPYNIHLDSEMASIAIDATGTTHVVWEGSTRWPNVGNVETDIFYANMQNAPPNQPSNTSPTNGATGISLTPTLEASAFSDPEEGDTLYASQWQISTSSGDFTNPVFDKVITSTSTQVSVPSDILEYDTTYYWQVRYQDSLGGWSSYSNETSFTTTGTNGETTEPSSWLTGRVIGAIAGGVVVLAVVIWLVFRRRPPAPG